MAKNEEAVKANGSNGEEVKKSNKSVLFIIVIALIAGIAGSTYLILHNSTLSKALVEKSQEQQEFQNVALDEFIINLSDTGYRRYLKTSLVLEFNVKEIASEVDKNNYKIRDAIINLLASKSFEDIKTEEGKTKLKKELVEEINQHLVKGKIKNLYWTEFVIQ